MLQSRTHSIISRTGRYGQQAIRYVFTADLAHTIRIQYDTHIHDLRFETQEFRSSTTKFGLICTMNKQILMLKQTDYQCSVYHSFIHKVLFQHN